MEHSKAATDKMKMQLGMSYPIKKKARRVVLAEMGLVLMVD